MFDLDGVLTQTAGVDSCRLEGAVRRYLRERAARKGERFVAFDPVADYDEYLDGKPRYDRSPWRRARRTTGRSCRHYRGLQPLGFLAPHDLPFAVEEEHHRRNAELRACALGQPVLTPVLVLAAGSVEPEHNEIRVKAG